MNEPGGEFEILPAAEMQHQYELYAEKVPSIRIDPAEVRRTCAI